MQRLFLEIYLQIFTEQISRLRITQQSFKKDLMSHQPCCRQCRDTAAAPPAARSPSGVSFGCRHTESDEATEVSARCPPPAGLLADPLHPQSGRARTNHNRWIRFFRTVFEVSEVTPGNTCSSRLQQTRRQISAALLQTAFRSACALWWYLPPELCKARITALPGTAKRRGISRQRSTTALSNAPRSTASTNYGYTRQTDGQVRGTRTDINSHCYSSSHIAV